MQDIFENIKLYNDQSAMGSKKQVNVTQNLHMQLETIDFGKPKFK